MDDVSLFVAIVAGVVCLLIGLGVGYLIGLSRVGGIR